MKRINVVVWVILILLSLAACNGSSSSSSPASSTSYNPPEDHTINRDGVLHKSGYDNPTENCASCHGDDLQGGSTGVSCFQCHGQEW